LFRSLDTDDKWRELASQWGTWLDSDGKLTPAGRVFMPQFGIKVTENMDRYQILFSVFAAAGRGQAAVIVTMLRNIHLSWPNPTKEQVTDLIIVTGTADYINELTRRMQRQEMTVAEHDRLAFRAIWQSMDTAFGLAGNPLTAAFDAAIDAGSNAADAFNVAVNEFNDKQIGVAAGAALRILIEAKDEIQVPITLVNPSLQDTLLVAPKYSGIAANSLLAKLMFDADYAAKKLLNSPELTKTIPRYQTEFAFRRSHPGGSGTRTSTAHLWISIDDVAASQSANGNILAFGDMKMRINTRKIGGTDRQLNEYEALLTSLYDDFARHFSPTFHELREAAKLGYAAQWLKARNANPKMPSEGRGTWDSPATAPGVVFVMWAPRGPDIGAASALGGITFEFKGKDILVVPGIDSGKDFETEIDTRTIPNRPIVIKIYEKKPPECEQGANVPVSVGPPAGPWKKGDYGEAALAALHPGGIEQLMADTIDSEVLKVLKGMGLGTLRRFIDWYRDETCMEAKEGYRELDQPTILQLHKDVFLRAKGPFKDKDGIVRQCRALEWHFFISPITGQCGPSPDLVKVLKRLKVRCVKHDDPRDGRLVAANCRPLPAQ
jgi:hypothetical protein